MRITYTTWRSIDLVTGRRVLDVCWLSASFGSSILQMLLLAQAWQVSPHALVPACLVSASTLGSLVGMGARRAPRAWGSAYLACVLLWLICPSFVAWHLSAGMLSPALVNLVALASIAVLLGACSSAWLAQQRPWPSVGEQVGLLRSLVGLTVGLVIAWTLPAWAPLIALTCCLPMYTLDLYSPSRSPLPRPAGVAARWVGRYWTFEQWPLQLETGGLLQDWRWLSRDWRSAMARGSLPLTWLASTVAVMLGCVWGGVPTPFAASLRAGHMLGTLVWLLGGQMGALAIGAGCLLAARGVIGFPARLLPGNWRSRLHFLTLLLPLAMAASLVALGLPFLQASWWLAISLASYTLAAAVWGMLLPRLRPDLRTVVQSQRHLLLRQRAGLPGSIQLAHGRACETRVTLLLARIEGALVALITPFCGWMIDRLGSVDALLILVGLALALGLAGAALARALVVVAHRLAQARSALRGQRLQFNSSVFPQLYAAAGR